MSMSKGGSKRGESGLINPPGPVEQYLISHGLPLTRENWLRLAYPFGLPEEWDQELENELPRSLRQDTTAVNKNKGKVRTRRLIGESGE